MTLSGHGLLKIFGAVATVALGIELFLLGYLLLALPGSPAPPTFGFDFAAFWSAAQLAFDGRAIESFQADVIGAIERSVVPATGSARWYYPPTMHLAIMPLGMFSYAAGLTAFTLASCLAWGVCGRLVTRGRSPFELAIVVAAPAAFFNVIQGQNGAFTALFLILFFQALLENRPRYAGLWAALLLVKPHLGLLIPLILLFGRHWRAMGWSAALAAGFCGLATLVFGAGYWSAFFANASTPLNVIGTGAFSQVLISGFALALANGASEMQALALQAATAVAAAWLAVRVWTGPVNNRDLKLATVLICGTMISPYAFHYDALVVAVAAYLMLRDGIARGRGGWEHSICVLVWLAPVIQAVLMNFIQFNITYVVMLIFMALCFRRTEMAAKAGRFTGSI